MRQMDPKKQEFFKKLEIYANEGKILNFPISTSLKDGRTPIFDNGVVQVPLDAAWNPPIGETRALIVAQTRRGRFYLKPADPSTLRKGEYDPDSPRETLSAMLRKGRNGSLYFRLPSGQVLIPLNEGAWRKHGAGKLIGREIELIGWPRHTCFVVMPRHGLNAISATTKVSVGETRKKMSEFEAEMGLVRVENTLGERIPVFANVVLGIPAETELTLALIKLARKQTILDIEATKTVLAIGNIKVTAEMCKVAAIEAYKVLEKLIGKGIKTVSSLEEAAPEIEEQETADEPKADDDGIVLCPTCGRKNRYLPESGPRDKALCGICKKPLFLEPVVAPAEPASLSEPVLDVETKPKRTRRPKKTAEPKKPDDDGQEAKLEAEAQAEAVRRLKSIIGGPIRNGRIKDLVSQTKVRDAKTFLKLAKSNPARIIEICQLTERQLRTATEQATEQAETSLK